MNGDIRKEEISSCITNLGLQESILVAHPTLLHPITFNRGHWESRSPIDGVWMSANLHASAVSLCPFSLSPGDHRAALLDIDLALLIGEPRLSIVRPNADDSTRSSHKQRLAICHYSRTTSYPTVSSPSYFNSTRMLPTHPLTTCPSAPA